MPLLCQHFGIWPTIKEKEKRNPDTASFSPIYQKVLFTYVAAWVILHTFVLYFQLYISKYKVKQQVRNVLKSTYLQK